MKKIIYIFAFILLLSEASFGQSVTIDPKNTSGNTPSIINIQSANQGVVVPKVTTMQKYAMTNQIDGMMVYDTDLKQFSYWKGGTGPTALGYWQDFGNPTVSGSGGPWNISGNDISSTNSGNVGIGTATPYSKLEIVTNGTEGLRVTQNGNNVGVRIQNLASENPNPVLQVDNIGSSYSGLFNSGTATAKGVLSNIVVSGSPFNAIEGKTEGTGNGGRFTSNLGTAGYFKSTSGHALITDGGNVGIDVANPSKARLEVGATNTTTAIFGTTSTGISLQQNWPTIGFNQYRDNSNVQRYIGDGFAMGNFMNPSNGNMYWVTNSTGNAGTTTSEETVLMNLSKEGRLGIGTSTTPNSTLLAVKGINFDGSAVFGGTTHASHFHYSTNEDTYIRGGKNGSKVIINDGPLGSVGIGISDFNFPAKLSVYQPTIESNSNTHVLHLRGQNPVQFFADQYNTTRGYIKGITNRSQTPQFAREGLEIGVATGDLYLTANYASSITISGLNNNVGIGTYPTNDYRLSVNGTTRTKELIVQTGWADYVFDENYKLRSIDELEIFVKENKHLPNIPKASEIEKNGMKVGETNKAMMEKIEELALYIIQLKKEIDILKSKN